jgi:hypothetical protein
VKAELIHNSRYKQGTARAKGGRAMTEASGGNTRTEMERRLVQRSMEDEDFRQKLLDDPRAAVEEELGTRLPEEIRVVAVQETSQTIYLVLPSASALVGEGGGELSELELEAVAGGGSVWDNTCGCDTAACPTKDVNECG